MYIMILFKLGVRGMLAPGDDYSLWVFIRSWVKLVDGEFKFPPPVFDESNPPKAIHIAVPDEVVPDEYWINQSLDEFFFFPCPAHAIA